MSTLNPSLPLSGRVALITGSSRGIGRQIALTLAAQGATIAVHYRTERQQAEAVCAEIAASGGRAQAFGADMGELADVRRLFADAESALGRLDILVLSAGFFILKPVAELSEAEYDSLFAVNTKGSFFAMQEAARRMQAGGRVVYISAASTGGAGAPGNAAATASKAASEFFVKTLARELGGRQITANVVCPGPTHTDNFNRLPAEVQQRAASMSALGRVGEPQDIADVVAFLCGHGGRWITGQVLRATGGA